MIYPDDISYYKKSKYMIVFCGDMNPCEYAIAVSKSKGLRNNDIIRTFSASIKNKLISAWKIRERNICNQHRGFWMLSRMREWSCHTSMVQRYLLSVSNYFFY